MVCGRRSGGASSGPRSLAEVQAVPPRGHEALPEGRALPDGEVRHRAPQLAAGRARPRPQQAVRVPAPAAREAEGAPLLRPAREAVPHLLHEGGEGHGRHRRDLAADARDPARQRRLPARLRSLARAGAPARPAWALPGERPPGEHPELPGQAGRRRQRRRRQLRRVLLSSLEGAAVTSVKIEGIAHEFTTLPGVREDVTDIILNLKNLICRLHGDSPEIEVHVAKSGPGTITAGDIEAPADLEILNPDLEIANLAKSGKLELTLTIGRGRGYLPAELNRGPEHTIGVIPIDSIFSPVRRVSYDVEAARVGQRTDYDKLTLDVTTDGSIDPRDSIAQAAEILIRQLAIFTDLEKIEGFGEAPAAAGDGAGPEIPLAHGMENFPIEELELGVRSYNCLKRVGIETIGDLVMKTEQELAAIPNFGKKSIEEVRETLSQHGLHLRGENGSGGGFE